MLTRCYLRTFKFSQFLYTYPLYKVPLRVFSVIRVRSNLARLNTVGICIGNQKGGDLLQDRIYIGNIFSRISLYRNHRSELCVFKNFCNQITDSGIKLYKLRSEKLIKLPAPKKEPMRIVRCFHSDESIRGVFKLFIARMVRYVLICTKS